MYYLQVIGTIIPVIKDLEYKFTSERKRSVIWYTFPGKNS